MWTTGKRSSGVNGSLAPKTKRYPAGDIPHILIGMTAEPVLMSAVIFENALHFVYMAVLRLYGKACHAREIVGMVQIGRNAVKNMEMKAVKAYCLPKISAYYMPVDPACIGFESVFMQMRVHNNLHQLVNKSLGDIKSPCFFHISFGNCNSILLICTKLYNLLKLIISMKRF